MVGVPNPQQPVAPDLDRIGQNVQSMINQNAPMADIDGYLASEGVTPDQLKRGQAASPETEAPVTAYGTAAAAATGLGKGGIGLAGTLGDLQSYADQGGQWLAGKLGVPQKTIDDTWAASREVSGRAPTTEQITNAAKSVGVPFHEPQNTLEKYTQSTAEIVPAVALGPGSALRKAAVIGASGIGSEAAGQATADTPYEPLARAGAALIGGGAAASIRGIPSMRAMHEAAPAAADLKAQTDAAYKALREAGVQYDTNKYQQSIVKLKNKLYSEGFREYANPKITGIVNDLAGLRNPTWDDLDSIRRTANKIVEDSLKRGGDSDLAGGKEVVKSIDTFTHEAPFATLKGVSPDSVVPLMNQARELASRNIKNRKIQKAIETAGTRQSGNDTALRNEFSKLLRPGKVEQFSPAEREAIANVAKGSVLRNSAYMGGKFGFDPSALSGKGVTLPSMLGAGTYMASDPLTAIGGLAGASALKFGARKATEGAADRAGATVRAGRAAQETAMAGRAVDRDAMRQRGLLAALNATLPVRDPRQEPRF